MCINRPFNSLFKIVSLFFLSLLNTTSYAAEEDNFIMLSAYNLAPYNAGYFESVLPVIAQHDIAGIVYATLGYQEKRYRDTSGIWGLFNENEYNKQIFNLATRNKARVWLQVRLYDNAGGHFADEVDSLQIESLVKNYTDNSAECKIILFEEASIYHKPNGGGSFWAGRTLAATATQNISNDKLFADNLARLFANLKTRILAVDQTCSVGIHIGHAPVYRMIGERSLLASAVDNMPSESKPDFIIYDLYARVVGDLNTFEQRLSTRLNSLKSELGVPVYYLGQLHTTNHFGYGGGQSPTVEDLQTGIRVARDAGVAGIGFYTKNTHNSRNDVEYKNHNTNQRVEAGLHEPQKTVFESSKDRFDYALTLIGSKKERFDLVFTGTGLSNGGYRHRGYYGVPPAQGRGKIRLSIKNRDGQWVSLGLIDPTLRGLSYQYGIDTQTYVVRGMPVSDYVIDNSVSLLLQGSDNETTTIDSISAIFQSESPQFLGADRLTTDTLQSLSAGVHRDAHIDTTTPGFVSINIANSSALSVTECIDTDGDGWGWDGSNSCQMNSIPQPPLNQFNNQRQTTACIDPDGDGWGWNGIETCIP